MGKFKNIYLFAKKFSLNSFNKQNFLEIKDAINHTINILHTQNCNLYFDATCKQFLTKRPGRGQSPTPTNYDLIIVIGGDGSLLNAIRETIDLKAPILGIHKGRLGFLADLNINKIKSNLTKILSGKYIEEKRSLLYVKIKRKNKTITSSAVNDIVLYNGKIPRLIEFQIFIDKQFVLQQRADGLIITTPTGSTAYSLSAGGPILYPTLKNFTLVPLSPHTLSSRPLVISEDSLIELKILHNSNTTDCGLSFDGQKNILLQPNDQITITKYPTEIRLIHPTNYNYFTVLREKLGWNN